MDKHHMSIRVVIFDVYNTLLNVKPAVEADSKWQKLWHEFFEIEPAMSRLDFSIVSGKAIARQHQVSRACGIIWPEVHWPSIIVECIPSVSRLAKSRRDEFIFELIQTGHTTWMSEETAATLRWLKDNHFLTGIASNAQAYTLRELKEALAKNGLDMDLFASTLCFWSFEHGYSKPDPHVFQMLTARAASMEIAPQEMLMVGDRFDNDVGPALNFGWHAWQLGESAHGNWDDLLRKLS